MANKMIMEFTLHPANSPQSFAMPYGANILSVVRRDSIDEDDSAFLCVLADPRNQYQQREIYVLKTGEDFLERPGRKPRFIDSFQTHRGAKTFHVFELLDTSIGEVAQFVRTGFWVSRGGPTK